MNQPMMAERDTCDHAYTYHMRGGAKLSVGICVLCKTVNFDDLDRQAAEIERAAYGRAVEALRSSSNYKLWHRQQLDTTGIDHHRWWTDARSILADYLEAVGRGDLAAPEQSFLDRRAAADPSVDHASHSMGWVGGCAECPQDQAAVVGGQPEQKEITDE